jgi:hypothetical protein
MSCHLVNTLHSRYRFNRLMLFRKIIAVFCENHTQHTSTLYGQNAEILNAKVDSTHSALKGFKVR